MLGQFFLIINMLTASLCWGYWRAVNVNHVDYLRDTRVIVAGRGDELGLLFQLAAISKAEAYLKINPSSQIIILSAVENEILFERELMHFKNRKFNNINKLTSSFGAREFFNEVSKFKRILSIDFFTHSTVKFGMRLDRSEDRLESMDDWSTLKKSLTDQSFLFLHGCNTGFELAPELAKQLNRPVMGSLTSTYFQRLTQDHKFVNSDDKNITGNQWYYPATYRLVPDSIPYNGYWGHFSGGGLGFFKTFCGNLLLKTCTVGMREMMNFWLSSSDDLNKRILDYLCFGRLESELGQLCQRSLETRNININTFNGNSLKCDFKKCQFILVCPQFDDLCDLINSSNGFDTIHSEYRAFLSL